MLIRISRLSLLCRILYKNSAYVLGLIRAMSDIPTGWISGVREDLNIISSHPDCAVFRDVPLLQCIDIISRDPRYWNKLIKRTFKLPYFSLIMSDKGQEGPPALSLTEPPEEPPPIYTCDICGQTETNYKKFRDHMFHEHKVKNQVRRLFCGLTCPICHTFHHTRERLFDHLKPEKHGPNRCLMLLNQRGPILTQLQANKLDALDKPYHLTLYKQGKKRNFAEYPPIPAIGPLITPEIFLNNPNNNNIVLEEDELSTDAEISSD